MSEKPEIFEYEVSGFPVPEEFRLNDEQWRSLERDYHFTVELREDVEREGFIEAIESVISDDPESRQIVYEILKERGKL